MSGLGFGMGEKPDILVMGWFTHLGYLKAYKKAKKLIECFICPLHGVCLQKDVFYVKQGEFLEVKCATDGCCRLLAKIRVEG